MVRLILIAFFLLGLSGCERKQKKVEFDGIDQVESSASESDYYFSEIGGHYYRFLKGTGRQKVKFLETDGFSPVVTEQMFVSWKFSDVTNLEYRDKLVKYPWVSTLSEINFVDEAHDKHISRLPKVGEHFYDITRARYGRDKKEGNGAFALVSVKPLYFDRHAVITCSSNSSPHGQIEPESGERRFFTLRDCSGSFQKHHFPEDYSDENVGSFPPHISFRRLTLGPFGPSTKVYSPDDPAFFDNVENSLSYFEEVIRKSYVGTELPKNDDEINFPLLNEE